MRVGRLWHSVTVPTARLSPFVFFRYSMPYKDAPTVMQAMAAEGMRTAGDIQGKEREIATLLEAAGLPAKTVKKMKSKSRFF